MLEVRDISVAYGAIKALHGVSLSVAKGEIVTLIGCNGAGKSTTLRAISGLVRPGSGDILYEGRSLRGVRAAAFDTRFDMAAVDSRMLRLAARVAGDNAYAASRIVAQLEAAGAEVVAEPEGFIVVDTEGPLRAGELERAAAWGASLLVAI